MKRILESTAHRQLRERCNGIDLSQFSMLTKGQYDYLLDELNPKKNEEILDLGCGLGKIAFEIQKKFGCIMSAIDKDEDFIQEAESKFANNIRFIKDDFDSFHWEGEKFNAIYSIDTLYFSSNIQSLLERLYSSLNPKGKLVLFWSQTVGKDADLFRLEAEKTNLGKILSKIDGKMTVKDFTKEEIDYWNRSYKTIREMKNDFLNEEDSDFLNSFSKETEKILKKVNDGHISRYCYSIQKSNIE